MKALASKLLPSKKSDSSSVPAPPSTAPQTRSREPKARPETKVEVSLPSSSSRSRNPSYKPRETPEGPPLAFPSAPDYDHPRSRAPSFVSSSYDRAELAPPSLYSYGASGPSSSSLPSVPEQTSGPLDPSSPAYRYEFERLQIEFRRSQENLRIEREANAAQRALYEREIEEAEHRHQAELASVRRRYGTDDSSSKRRRE